MSESSMINPYSQRLMNSDAAAAIKAVVPALRDMKESLPEKIESDMQAESCASIVVDAKAVLKPLEKERKVLAQEIREITSGLSETYNALSGELSLIISTCTGMASDYAIEKAARQTAESQIARAEDRKRLRSIHADEINRLSDELAILLGKMKAPEVSTAQVLALSRDANRISTKLDELGVDINPTSDVAQVKGATVSGSGVSITTSKTISFEIVNEADIPREYLMVDEKKIREAFAKNPEIQIPGVLVKSTPRVRINARG